MPVTTFSVTANADDGFLSRDGTGEFPPTGAITAPTNTSSDFGGQVRKLVNTGISFSNVCTGILQIDTSGLSDAAVVVSAVLRISITSKATDVAWSPSLNFEYYDLEASIGTEDYVEDVGTTAAQVASGTWQAWPTSGTVDVNLSNLGSINRTGYTGFRIGMNGTPPDSTGHNRINFAELDHATRTEAQLIVTWEDNFTVASFPLVTPMALARFHKPKLFSFPLYPEVPGPLAQFFDLTAAAETNAAQALSFIKTILKTLGFASETDAAQTLNVDKSKLLGVALESDAAQALLKYKSKLLGPSAETDAAQALSVTKTIFKTLGVASEADVAQAITKYKSLALTSAAETDAAQALNVDKIKVLIPATETDVAQVLSITTGGGGTPIEMTLTPATESDVAQALTASKRVTIITALEADAAVGLTKAKLLTLGFALETDAAQGLTFTKTIYKNLTPAQEFDVARTLVIEGETVTVVYKYRGPIVMGRF
jgi:hypothetical protein